MAINSVATASSAMQQLQSAKQQTQNLRAADEAPKPRGELNASERATRPSQGQEVERAQQPKPVVNAQGQKTGTIVNTTA